MNALNHIISSVLAWRLRNLSHRHFILILSAILGVFVGAFAVIVKFLIHEFYNIVTNIKDVSHISFLFFLPLIGILLTFLMAKYLFKDNLGHGVTTVLFRISKGSSILKKRLSVSRVFTAIVTIGFGGSVGLEAPLVTTGSALGSNFAKLMRLHYKSRTLLIGCGSAAAVAGIFNSPIAGVIFAIEIILSEVNIEKFIPILLSSVCAALVSMIFQQNEVLFNFVLNDPLRTIDIPYYFFLGIACGLVAVYFTRTHYFIEGVLTAIKNSYVRIAVGGLALSVIIFFFPAMYGEGYTTIKALINGSEQSLASSDLIFSSMDPATSLLVVSVLMIFIKAVASACTIGAGGSGGIFAPSLFVGGLTGFVFTRLSSVLGLNDQLSVANFTLLGMCGVLTAVLHAPLTGIFLIAEITGGYTLFLPLMLVSVLAYTTISIFEPHSIYTKHLIEKGDLIQGNKDKEIISLIEKKKLIMTDEFVLNPLDKISALLDVIRLTDRSSFYVVDEHQELLGVINWDDVKNIVLNKQKQEAVVINTVMHNVKILIENNDSTHTIMHKFEKSAKWYLPVLDKNGKYKGYIQKETLFNVYRNRLIKQYEQEV